MPRVDRLWDSAHPYYCSEGCYSVREDKRCHINVASWQTFKSGQADGCWYRVDEDSNLLYRWDWKEYETEEGEMHVVPAHIILCLFFMQQRLARPQRIHVLVTRDDEPEIRAWLADKWRHLQRLWTPLAPDVQPGADEEVCAEQAVLHYGRSVPPAPIKEEPPA